MNSNPRVLDSKTVHPFLSGENEYRMFKKPFGLEKKGGLYSEPTVTYTKHIIVDRDCDGIPGGEFLRTNLQLASTSKKS